MRVYHVIVDGTGYYTCTNGVIVDLFDKVVGVAAGELYAAQVIGAHIIEVGIDMVTEAEIEIRIHDIAYALLHVFTVDIAPADRHLRHSYYIGEVTLLVTVRLGYDKCNVHVATLPHALSETVAGSAETAEDVRWEFPPEH